MVHEIRTNQDKILITCLTLLDFDTIIHRILLAKLHSFGLSDNSVKILNDIGQNIITFKGVPQGSILDPFLFTIYVADMSGCISSKLKQYADNSQVQNAFSFDYIDDSM